MGRNALLFSIVAAVIGSPLLAGCGEETTTIQLSYERPAEKQIPEKIKKIAVAEFSGRTPADQRWGGIAADKLSAELDKLNATYNRYELVDRRNLAQVLKEQDVQIMSANQAIKFGKLANVQAMIFGNVSVSTHDERASSQQFDLATRGTKTVYHTRRVVSGSVNLTMTDIDTGKTIHTFTLPISYDSDKDKSAIAGFLPFNSENPPPADETVNKRVDVAVADFAKQISPHRETMKVKLENGKSDKVLSGNKAAKAGDYNLALEEYKAATAQHPDDDGAFFDAGVMYEAKGDLASAEQQYLKAYQISSKDHYIAAKQRVGGPGK